MTAKEKAKELFDKMYFVDDPIGNYPMCFETAKQCALIAVDEMINWKETLFVTEGSMAYQYLLKVKQEIQNL
jgi:hypothetical protein